MTQSYHQPSIFYQFSEITAAESRRNGGISPVPYYSLNLGINTEDDSANVDENRRLFFKAIGWESGAFAGSYQVHGTKVMRAEKAEQAHGYDALISNKKGLLVGVTIADCCPILIYDSVNKAVAAIHAGWKGTVGRIVLATLQQMQLEFGTQAADCYAYVGTCISQDCYEVDEKVAVRFAEKHKIAREQAGKWLVDIRAANRDYLLSFGIPENQIEVSPFCTWKNNDDYFSYRKENGTTGRMLAVIGIF